VAQGLNPPRFVTDRPHCSRCKRTIRHLRSPVDCSRPSISGHTEHSPSQLVLCRSWTVCCCHFGTSSLRSRQYPV